MISRVSGVDMIFPSFSNPFYCGCDLSGKSTLYVTTMNGYFSLAGLKVNSGITLERPALRRVGTKLFIL
jgi:hypothetical protein